MTFPKIFLDSGDPEETKKVKKLLGTLDGQTTNPTLVARHPEAKKFLESGKKLNEKELLNFYKQIVEQIAQVISGPISVEVYADWDTSAEMMLRQAREMFTWGKYIQIKFPTIPEGVRAANQFVKEGGRVNMTLVFSQEQAASVFVATKPTKEPAFVSPFVGRWYDRGYDGMDLLQNIITMYKKFYETTDKEKYHVLVLASSIRNLEQFYNAIYLGSDLMTVPISIIEDWVKNGKKLPEERIQTPNQELKPIPYKDLALEDNFGDYDIKRVEGDLLDEGVKRFVSDWKSLLV